VFDFVDEVEVELEQLPEEPGDEQEVLAPVADAPTRGALPVPAR
jgi:hypothetical protein